MRKSGQLMTRGDYGSVMYRIIATLLLTVVHSLPGAAPTTNELNGKASAAAMSRNRRVTQPNTSTGPASAHLQPSRAAVGALIFQQKGKATKEPTPPRDPLDLRPPDLQSIESLLPRQETPPAGTDYIMPVAIVGTPAQPDKSSNIRLADTGIRAIYLAARHPTQAWRVLLPIVPHDGSAVSDDITAQCASSWPHGGQTACLEEPAYKSAYARSTDNTAHTKNLSSAPTMIASIPVSGTLSTKP
jgi:hypothetical protein